MGKGNVEAVFECRRLFDIAQSNQHYGRTQAVKSIFFRGATAPPARGKTVSRNASKKTSTSGPCRQKVAQRSPRMIPQLYLLFADCTQIQLHGQFPFISSWPQLPEAA